MSKKRTNAFSLVEVTLALGVAAFCLLAVFGLIPIGLNSNRATTEQTGAMSVITSVVADLRNTPQAATVSPRYLIPFPITSPQTLFLADSATAVAQSSARYRIKITSPAPAAASRMATWLIVEAFWPAVASEANASGSTKTFVALDRN